MDRQEELDLIAKVKAGCNDSFCRLVDGHMGFLWNKSRPFHGVTREECHQQVLIAFYRCILRFDPARGFRLLTYANNPIRWATDYLRMDTYLIRPPTNQSLNLPNITEKRRAAARRLKDAKIGSFDTPLPSGMGKVGNLIEDDRVANDVDRRETVEMVRECIGRLPHRMRTVMRGRLDGQTLEEIARPMGISRERVRQIETQAYDELAVMLVPLVN